jgi:hypothetical protein
MQRAHGAVLFRPASSETSPHRFACRHNTYHTEVPSIMDQSQRHQIARRAGALLDQGYH